MEIHDKKRMEGFQEKENTFVERKAKGSPVEIRHYARLIETIIIYR